MEDVGEIWRRARRDQTYRDHLERDPASVLAGTDLNDDELALLDAALRASHPSSTGGDLFSLALEPVTAPSHLRDPGSEPTATKPGGEPTAGRREHP